MDHRAFFNERAERWDEKAHHDPAKLRRIAALAAPAPGAAVLDVGTGTGVMLPLLRAGIGSGGRLAALDVAERMTARAREKHGSTAAYLAADAMCLPFGAGAFDLVMCYSVFPHFTDKRAALCELARVLRPGGSIVVAHSEGRAAINAFHAGLQGLVNQDRLPENDVMLALGRAAGLVGRFLADEEGVYVVGFKKEGAGE